MHWSLNSKRKTPNNDYQISSVRTISPEQNRLSAGTVDDPQRLAMGFPGVQASQDNNSDIIIRGNSPTGMLWRLEGVEIPNPNHFARKGSSGGGITMFSAQLLGKSDFSTGAFAAEYGNAFSGAFDMRFRKGNVDEREYRFKFGLLGTDLATEGPIKKGQSSYLVNYRYSTLGILNDIGFRLVGKRIDNNFQDLSFNIYLPSKDKNRTLTIFGVGGLSEELWDAVEDSLSWSTNYRTQRTFLTNMGVFGATYTHLLDTKSYIKAVAVVAGQQVIDNDDLVDISGITLQSDGVTNDPIDLSNVNTSPFEKEDYQNSRVATHIFYNRQVNDRISMRSGVLASHLRFNFKQDVYSESTGEATTILEGNDNSNLIQGYTQFKVQLSSRLSMNAGVHGMFLTLNNTSSIEPRLAFKYLANERNSITLAYGLHSRVLPLGSYFTKITDDNGMITQPNMNLEMVKSHHFVLGHKVNIGESMRLGTELYYQHLYDVPVSTDINSTYWILNERDGYATQALTSEGTGRNMGIDLSLEKSFEDGLFFLIAGSVFDSKYTALNGEEYNTRYNSRFSVSGMLGKEFTLRNGNALELGTRVVSTGGLKYTPGDKALSEAAGEYVPIETKAFTENIGTYFRIDGRIAYRINRSKVAYRFAIDVQNATNRINKKDVIWDEGFNDFVKRNQSGLIPVFSIQIDF